MKRLVLCCDGTWNSADQQRNGAPCPTNVVKLAFHTAKRDGALAQIVFYDQGVGTGNVLDRVTGGAFGEGLEDNIYDAYRFLIANYERNDELFLFGFSRGAYTARSIAGMIRKCGILRRESVSKYRQALDLYRDPRKADDSALLAFRRDHSVAGGDDIPIKFIGVWDTVGALGVPLRGLRGLTRRSHQFHDTELSGTVQYAFHALAIDEHRSPFEPTLWMYKPKPGQTVEQVWFCGAHSDVGGGYAESELSDIPLQWMLEKANAAGLVLDANVRISYPLRGSPRGPLHDSKTGLYRLTAGIERAIGLAAPVPGSRASTPRELDPTQSVHDSVRQRWDSDPSYRPSELRTYFQRTGDPRH